MTADIA